MKNRILILLVMIIGLTGNALAQRRLEVNDVTTSMNVFSGKDTEAGLVISCPSNMQLSFESSHDKKVDVYNTEVKGEEIFYYIRFNTGRRYRGRKLTIRTDEFAPVTLDVDLNPKELKQYQLVDPDADFIYGTYYEFRKRGMEYFQNAMYTEAREQFIIAKESSDAPDNNNIGELIANIDSIEVWQQQASQAYDMLDYQKADELYGKIISLNPQDANASSKRYDSRRLYDNDCKRYYDNAEVYKEDGEYEKALELYQRVIDLNCSSALLASEQVKQIKLLMQNRNQKAHVLAYEYSKNTPIGITTGTYKTRKTGGYFSLSLHKDVFEIMRNNYDKATDAELNISAGFTLCPVKQAPVWIFFGPGYTGVGVYENEDGTTYVPGSYVEGTSGEKVEGKVYDKPTLKVHSAISPEIGLLGKIGPIVLRYTFQYRFAIAKDDADLIKKTRHVFGIGFCF